MLGFQPGKNLEICKRQEPVGGLKVERQHVLVKLYLIASRHSSVSRRLSLSPHDALEHHFTSLKTDLIFLQPRVLEQKFP